MYGLHRRVTGFDHTLKEKKSMNNPLEKAQKRSKIFEISHKTCSILVLGELLRDGSENITEVGLMKNLQK